MLWSKDTYDGLNSLYSDILLVL